MASTPRKTLSRPPQIQNPNEAPWAFPVDPSQIPNYPLSVDGGNGDGDDDEQTDVDRITALLTQSSSVVRASVKVYKQINGTSEFCKSFTPTEFEEGDYDMLRDNFGAGRYKIVLYGERPGSKHFGIISKVEVSIAEAINKNNNQNINENGLPSGLTQVLSNLAENQRQTLEALVAIKQAPAVDPMAQMQTMLSMMTMMRTAMGLDSAPKASPLGEIIASIKELRGVASEILPERDTEETGLSAMLPKALEIIQSGMQNQQQQNQQIQPQLMTPQQFQQTDQNYQPNPVPQMRGISVPVGIQAAPTHTVERPIQQTTTGDDVNFSEMVELRKNLNLMIEWARSDVHPQNGADLIYEKLPDAMVEMLGLDHWFSMLRMTAPEVAPFEAWFTKARDLALAMFDDPESAEPAELGGASANGAPDTSKGAWVVPAIDTGKLDSDQK